MNISGRRLNKTMTREGCWHSRVKKWLKKHITRTVRRRLKAQLPNE